MKKTTRSMLFGLGQLMVILTVLIAVGCEAPVGVSTVGTEISKAARGAWAPNVTYATGDTVTYNGVTYTCLQGHTSLTGWEPPNVPALWQPVTGSTPTPTPTPTVTPTPTPTPTGVTPTPTPTTTATPTPTPTTTATPTPSVTPTPNGNLTKGFKANQNGRYFTAYYPSWSDNWFVVNNWDGTKKPDNQIYDESHLVSFVPGQVTHLMLAFAQPDFAWGGISANSWSGTGLSFNATPQDIKESIRLLHILNRKVILSVGGANYNNWSGLASNAGGGGSIRSALTQFMIDMNVDGLDVDYEPSGIDSAHLTEYANAIQAMKEAVNAAGGGRILMNAVWSTGADYIAGTEGDAGYPGKISFWGGNAGRERLVFKRTVSSGPFAGRTIGSLHDVVNVMSYDAGYTNYDPVTAYGEYRALLPSNVVVGAGLEIPTEAWGGATLVLANGDSGATGTVVQMDQYNRTPRGPYSVERTVGAAKNSGVNSHDGAMLWQILKTSSSTNANATSVATYVGNMFGWVAVGP